MSEPIRAQLEIAEQETARVIAAHQQPIAAILDHPSVYMSGPSQASMRRAKMICEYLAARRLESRPSTTGQEISEAMVEKIADAILRASGTGLRYFSPQGKAATLNAARAALQDIQKG